MKEIRELLVVKIGKGQFDTQYTLVRNEEGQLYVETFESPTEPEIRGSTGPTIFATDFEKHVIYGTTLGEYVATALNRVDGSVRRRSKRGAQSLSEREFRAGTSENRVRNNSSGVSRLCEP